MLAMTVAADDVLGAGQRVALGRGISTGETEMRSIEGHAGYAANAK
jgi:hypothetical protein